MSTEGKTGTAQIGVVGMAVMGSNLARNFASKGFKTAIFNRSYAKTEAVLEAHPEAEFVASESVEEFVDSLEKPRRIIMMVKAGPATDATIDTLIPFLDQGDGGATGFLIEPVDAPHRFSARHPEHVGHGRQFAEELDRRGASADDQHALTGEGVRAGIVGRVKLATTEVRGAGIGRQERLVPGAGGVDDRVSTPDPCRRLDHQRAARIIRGIIDAQDVDWALHRQVELALIGREISGHLNVGSRREVEVGGALAREVRHPVHVVHREAVPPVLPGAAGRVVGVEDDEVDIKAL